MTLNVPDQTPNGRAFGELDTIIISHRAAYVGHTVGIVAIVNVGVGLSGRERGLYTQVLGVRRVVHDVRTEAGLDTAVLGLDICSHLGCGGLLRGLFAVEQVAGRLNCSVVAAVYGARES